MRYRHFVLLVPPFLLIAGCAAPRQISSSHPKIAAMRATIQQQLADDIRHEEKFFSGKPLEFDYSVAIEPRYSNGFTEIGEGGENFLGTGRPGNLSFMCASETIDSADVATVHSSILGADHGMRSDIRLYVWRHNRWMSGSEAVMEDLRAMDPAQAKKLESELAQLQEMKPATAPSSSR
jgi:hypothetical protein